MARFYFQSLWAALQWAGFSETTELLPEKSNWSFFECKLETLLILIKSMQLCKASFKCNISLKTDTTCYFSLTHDCVDCDLDKCLWKLQCRESKMQQAAGTWQLQGPHQSLHCSTTNYFEKDWKSRFNFFLILKFILFF